MDNDKRYSKQLALRQMNMALDDSLSDSERATLDVQLNHDDAMLWDNMQRVDRLLSTEPMIEAPFDFAAKVMASIATAKAPTRVRTDLRAAMGLLLTALALLPLVIATLLFVRRWLNDPQALNALIHQITLLFNTIVQAATSVFQLLVPSIGGNWMVIAIITTLAPIVLFAGVVRWYYAAFSRRDVVVYRIPVIAA
jgi:hypothetical protein